MDETILGTPGPERIAVVRALRGLGDMLCVVPALRALRRALPEARVTLVGLEGMRWLLERYPGYLDDFLPFPGYPGIPEEPFDPLRLAGFVRSVQGRFDLAIQMHGSGTNSNAFAAMLGARRTAGLYLPSLWCPDPETFLPYPGHVHEIRQWLQLLEHLGIPVRGEDLEFPVSETDRRRLAAVWDGAERAEYVVLHPGATDPVRRWPAERFAEAGDRLAAEGFAVVLTGSNDERPLAERVRDLMAAAPVDLTGRTDLGSLGALLQGARLLVCNDTGVSHLAAAVRCPSVVVFSASDPARWAPLDTSLHRVVGEIRPQRVNACVHTPEIRGHRCLRDACSSLLLPSDDSWRPAETGLVLHEAARLLGAPR